MQATRAEPSPGIWRYSAAGFLVMIVLMYLTEPYVERLPDGRVARGLIMSFVLFSGGLAVGERKGILVWAAVLGIPSIIMTWLWHFRPDLVSREVAVGTALLFVLFVSARLFRFVLTARTVDSEVLCAAVATYLMLGLGLTLSYILVALADPHAFAWTVSPATGQAMDGFTAMYYSLTTQATLGPGDIVPVSPTARLLTMTQAIGGMFYVTILIARLVGVYSSQNRETGRG
ncbi:MAG TPA: ion channel [Thermoanaerobaculia bacterium]|nr:ion channel [Thermoanaerobaculia bacterium]